jgi:phage gp36-like protein
MRYINKDDIVAIIHERLINESVAMDTAIPLVDNDIIVDIESKAIDLVISYISRRYNHVEIFSDTPIRNGVLVQLISSIVVYRAVKRNAARKVPDDYVELYKEAIKTLEKIQAGAMDLIGCPLLINGDGSPVSPLWGNSTNDNNFV